VLKLNYSEDGLYIEQIKGSPEQLIAQRVVLSVRSGVPIYIEPGHASFLLPVGLPELTSLNVPVRRGRKVKMSIARVDDEFVEVSLRGTWVASSKDAHEGMFLVVMSDRTESLIYQLWQTSEVHVSSLA
jgi:hypothetical protein